MRERTRILGRSSTPTKAAWDKTMEVNLRGPYLLSSMCAKQMTAEKSGSIINVSSVAGLTASPHQGIYSVSKAGLIMLTKVMARELGENGIRVNCLCPGLIKTQLSEALWKNPKLEASIVNMKALRRIGETDELVGAAIYFASDASSLYDWNRAARRRRHGLLNREDFRAN